MAVEIQPAEGTIKQSIARVEILTNAQRAQNDWMVAFQFENGTYDDGGSLIDGKTTPARTVGRLFRDIAGQSFTAAGATVTGTQLAALIQAAGYQFRTEDIANGASAPPLTPPPPTPPTPPQGDAEQQS